LKTLSITDRVFCFEEAREKKQEKRSKRKEAREKKQEKRSKRKEAREKK